MTSDHKIKIYNKDNKIKVLINDAGDSRVISLYKYEKEVVHTHSYTIKAPVKSRVRMIKNEDDVYVNAELKLGHKGKIRNKYHTYYDYTKMVDEVPTETIRMSDLRLEHWERIGDMEEIKTEKVFKSGNIYETKTKAIDDGHMLNVFRALFENGEMKSFSFSLPENKINEYLQKIDYER